MTRHDQPLPPAVEADVAARLERALRGSLSDTYVDVPRLAVGTRTGVRRAAVRRSVTVAVAAVAAVAIPVALTGAFGSLGALDPTGAAASSTATSTGPAPTAAAVPTPFPAQEATTAPTVTAEATRTASPPDPVVVPPDPTGTNEAVAAEEPVTPGPDAVVVAWKIAAASDDYNEIAYRIPPQVVLASSELPQPVTRQLDITDYGGNPVVSGQRCNRPVTTPRPVAGGQWSWFDAGDSEAFAATLVVTGWAPGTAADRFQELVDNSSEVCAFDEPQTPASTTGMTAGDDYAAATGAGPQPPSGWAAVRVGDVIVSVSVDDDAGRAASVAAARTLASLVAARVTSSGLAATAAAGG
jgi:hypothetical protein